MVYVLAGVLALHSCKIENDIPYPIVEGNITAFEVEGQTTSPTGTAGSQISTTNRTVTLYVDDKVDLTKLRITRFTVSNEAVIVPDSAACVDVSLFPTAGFETPDNLADTRMNFTNPVRFKLTTYQDYWWTVTVTQQIERTINVEGMVNAVVDVEHRTAIIYVTEEQDLSNIQVHTMNLGGASGTVTPNPTTVHDFTSPQTFLVSHGWEDGVSNEWTVYVYHTADSGSSSDVFARTTSATLTGTLVSGQTPVVQYKESSAADWTDGNATVSGTSYTADFTGLRAATSYQYQVTINGTVASTGTFTTTPATPLTNGGLEDWSSEAANNGTLWNPWAAGADSYWTTGNRGATTIADSNTKPTEETSTGAGQAALLQTKWLVMKLAAGNLFTGDFELDGTHGILTLGRDFSAFPSALRFHCKYTTSNIDHVPTGADLTSDIEWLTALRGKPDTCHVYIALTTEKVILSTRNHDIFDPNASSVVAYGEFQSGQNVSGEETNGYKQIDIPLNYRQANVTPKYLIIVSSSSKYGNLFTGGEGSNLYLDEMELIYE